MGEWVEDRIALLFVDLPEERKDEIADIKAYIEKTYQEEGSAQDELWCTIERIEVL
jgi:hypothetical protein